MVPETTPENFSSVGILCSALQRFQIQVKIKFSNANYLAIRAPTELISLYAKVVRKFLSIYLVAREGQDLWDTLFWVRRDPGGQQCMLK